jgi:alanyl-tRNA synthetase
MTSSDIRSKYISFFQSKGHAVIPSAPLVPENDPTTLFTSSGMQPLIPYLLGEPHPLGKRLVNSQKSFRAQDIDEVGDNRHTTFFEMLGNWSLGDYFKKEQLPWIFGFITKELGIDPKRLYVSVFEGNESVPKDIESINIWKEIFSEVGILSKEGERIFTYPAKKNWWSRSGEPDKMPPGEPGGPDSEVFYDFGEEHKFHEHSSFKDQKCHPNCDCGRFIEIANSVFMQYKKDEHGKLVELQNKNVDFGGGLERMTAVVQHTPDVFATDMFQTMIKIIETLSKNKQYGRNEKETRAMRVIADHIRGSIMMMNDGVIPSNKTQGYVLRRLIRRALLYGRNLGFGQDFSYISRFVDPVIESYKFAYPSIIKQRDVIINLLSDEAKRFEKSLERGLKEIEKTPIVTGTTAFSLYESYGFPWELTHEIAASRGLTINKKEFEQAFEKHRELSRTAAKGMFKGGLQNQSEQITKLHTATHLLHQALRMILGTHVSQKGSNITADRLRFDFSHPTKISSDDLQKVESIINKQIDNNLPVTMEEFAKDDALKSGALGFFVEKYGDRVKVYTIGDPKNPFSKEICGGPHVDFTGTLGHFRIKKEEALGSGVRRIYAELV